MSFKDGLLKTKSLIIVLSVSFTILCVNPAWAVTVTDEIGRSVKINPSPQKIVSLAPGITETLYALKLDHQIAGVTTFCDWPLAARKKTKIGGFTNPSIEKIVSLKPDLIIATADGNRKDTVDQLERLGLSVYVTKPADTRGVLQSILNIGKITNRERIAAETVAKLQNRLNNIASQIHRNHKPRVFFQLGLEPVITAGRNTLINDVIERAGGVNIAGQDIANYPRYSAEGIMAASPEVIIFAPMVNDREFVMVKRFWKRYDKVPAVRNGRIYPIDADLINRASPRIVEAVEKMAFIFHPDIKCPG